jgi:hypothetical protein
MTVITVRLVRCLPPETRAVDVAALDGAQSLVKP